MPTQVIRDLRTRYRTSYTAYMGSVHALAEVRKPPPDVLDTERRTLAKLVTARDAFLDALLTHYRGSSPHL